MDFEKTVWLVDTVTDLHRLASAHVIDRNQLNDDEPRAALDTSKPSSPQHKKRETTFPLGLPTASRRYERRSLGKLVA